MSLLAPIALALGVTLPIVVVFYLLKVRRHDEERPSAVVTVFSDVTEQRQAQQALREQDAYFRQLFENSPEAIAILDTDDRVVDVNRAFGTLFQYTIEAYKTFEKLAENLANPLTANMFKQFAADERATRDLIEMKIAATGTDRLRVTLANDLAFQDILEGDLSYRETTEFLIAREQTMERKLAELGRGATVVDRAFVVYLGAAKRSHIVELERELELTKLDRDWFKREDAEARLVRGAATA